MATRLIDETRIRLLNEADPRRGKYVLYWMQNAQRAEFNPALEYAIQCANERGRRLLVVFGLMGDYPEANARHLRFMLEGLAGVQGALERRGIRFLVRRGRPDTVAIDAARNADLVVCDRGYLRHQVRWRRALVEAAGCPVVQVEGEAVVPVEIASAKPEFAARTIRRKLHTQHERYLVDLDPTPLDADSLNLPRDPHGDAVDLDALDAALQSLDADPRVPPVSELFEGGTSQARARFEAFLDTHLDGYDEQRNQPQCDAVSTMGMYLHFGQISPVWLALRVRRERARARADVDALLEELLVRRELAINFVHYTPNYDKYACLPDWARSTLGEHRDDEREHVYTRHELERAQTHDPYWNAAMNEARHTGYMHNYMRMYWGKKILEWTNTPEYGHRVLLALNNRYFLDGRDPNSYANCAWVFGLHDRPWGERPVFGKVRYMNAAGLERKCDIEAYVAKVATLAAQHRAPAD